MMPVPKKGRKPSFSLAADESDVERATTAGMPSRTRSVASERRIAKALGGRTQPNSGAVSRASGKGDVRTAEYLIEAKETDKPSFSVNLRLLGKITDEARGMGRVPLVHLTIGGLPAGIEKQWMMVPWSEWLALMEQVRFCEPSNSEKCRDNDEPED